MYPTLYSAPVEQVNIIIGGVLYVPNALLRSCRTSQHYYRRCDNIAGLVGSIKFILCPPPCKLLINQLSLAYVHATTSHRIRPLK